MFAGQGDQRLLVDLDDPDQVELLRGLVAAPTDDGELVLQEALPDVDSAWLPGPGRHLRRRARGAAGPADAAGRDGR